MHHAAVKSCSKSAFIQYNVKSTILLQILAVRGDLKKNKLKDNFSH